ncbi:MAG: response regulator transcription factor [Williamsia sp.]|nr:response regulator transcription factor [Williamsia sp.]
MTTEQTYKFIIIDDHPLIRDGIRSYIDAHDDFEFIGEFHDTRSVLNAHFRQNPDVIILDLSLPGMDGERALPLLKRKYPGCKIVAFTQHEAREKELRKIGFDGYVTKNERDQLVVALHSVLEGKPYFTSGQPNAVQPAADPEKMDAYLKLKQLTPRETEVAKYMKEDFSNREIAEKIFISESTVETHRKHIKEKLGVKSRRELAALLRKIDFS